MSFDSFSNNFELENFDFGTFDFEALGDIGDLEDLGEFEGLF